MKRLLLIFPIIAFANVQQIEYEGLIHLSPISANSLIDIKKGDDFDISKIDSSIKKLYETGYFEYIKAIREGNKLIFKCQEKPVIYQVELENVSDELRKVLKDQKILPKKGDILTEENLNKIKEFIKSYYLSKGYFNTQVDIQKNFLSQNRVSLTINVNEGDSIYIRRVNFYGAHFDKYKLLDELENRPKTPLSILPFFNSGELSLYNLFTDKNSLQDYYLNLGYMDAVVSDPFVKINFDSNFADIDYKIKEGKRFIVSKVTLDYPHNIEIKRVDFNLKVGKYFNVSAIRKDIKNIRRLFADRGYAFAKVYPQIIKYDNKVEVVYRVIPGNIYYIRNVIIKGNSKTLDRVIRRDIYLAPGDKFSLTDLQDSINSLKRRGYFEKVNIKKVKVSSNQLDLIVDVKEGLTGSLRGGISYSSYSQFGLNFSISEKNIFGSGQRLKAQLDATSKSSSYSFSLYNPRVLDSLYSSNISIFKTKFIGISYTTRKTGISIGVGKALNRFLTANIDYSYAHIKLTDYSTSLDYLKPNSIKSSVTTSLNYDDTDNYFFPTSGKKASISVEFTGVGGDEKFIKTLGSFKYFYPLTNKVYKTYAVLKYRIVGGNIIKNGYLPISEKFYLGGVDSVRGFSYYTISPTDSNNNYIGGKYELINSVEISTPLSLKNRLWLSGFVDYGAVGENSLNISRASYGFNIDWITPVGPLKFVWAWPLKSKKGDDLRRFEFTIGTGF